jgi:hypothetical protein
MRAVSVRTAFRALLPFALYALAREVDAALGVVLRTTLDLPRLPLEALALLDPAAVFRSVALWLAAGAVLWLGLAALRRDPAGFAAALRAEAGAFDPLYLRPGLTLLALASLALRPTYPYGFTLPVALTQDWAPAQDLATVAALLATRLTPLTPLRWPAPSAGGLFFVVLLGYALLTPERVLHWDGHPGNEPKYLRMGVALESALSLDVAEVSGLPDESPPLESVVPRPLLASAAAAGRTLLSESARMLGALAQGPKAVGAEAIRATRLARQTVQGKEGGVFHVLSPGPSLLLAPTLRIDRALNLARGTPGRLGVTVLAWNAMGAALIAVLYLFLCDVTGRRGLSALAAGGLALAPPFVFYFFQFYPEMPGALLLTLAVRRLLFSTDTGTRGLLGLGLVLAALPWLHQKFLPVFALLVVWAVVQAVDRLVRLPALVALVAPPALSLYLTALWNFAITGSARPDALFLAWGPGGVTSARIGEGALGLLLDARFGLLPAAPVYLLAAAGVWAGARLAWALPAALGYHLTVAAADNWSGSVCNLGRYAMPVVPLLAALAGAALTRLPGRRGVAAVVLALSAWTGLLSLALWRDPRAANDTGLLIDKAAFADAHVYLPDLFFRSPLYQSPGHGVRTLAWLALAGLLGLWLWRAARGHGGVSAARALFGLATVVLATGLLLERWPSTRRTARFLDALPVAPGVVVFVSGDGEAAADHVRARSGTLELLVRSRPGVDALEVTATGEGLLRAPGQSPVPLRPGGTALLLPLEPLRTLTGRGGAREALATSYLRISSPGEVALRLAAVDSREPAGGGLRP